MAEESKTTHDRTMMGHVERVAAILRSHLEDEAAVLDVLVSEAARGRGHPELWAELHQAAARDDMLPELAFAYEQLARSKKLKSAPPTVQVEVLMHAATFFTETFGDGDGATDYLERVLEIDPGHPEAFAHLERLLVASKSWDELSSLYLRTAAHRREPRDRIALLRRAAELFDRIPGEVDRAIRIYEEILRIDPGQRRFRRTLEARYLLAGRTHEAAAFLEQVLAGDPPPDDDEAFAMRTRLMALYAGELGDLTHALPHVEELLRRDPAHEQARVVAERLLTDRTCAARAAAALADAWERLGSPADAAAVLAVQLEHVDGAERLVTQRRLGILRHEALSDPAGALPLLEAVLLADPGDDEVRTRFREASAALDRRLEAARTLARAAGLTKDLGLRARIGTELGALLVEAGDKKRARAVFQEVLDRGGDDRARIVAARELATLYAEAREYRPLAAVLELLARSDPDAEARLEAAERLALVCESMLGDTDGAIRAWRRLLGTPRELKAVTALETLYERAGMEDELADALERRARASTGVTSRVAAFRAAEIRSRRLPPAQAIEVWRRFVATYGPARDAHAALIALLETAGMHEELALVLAQDATLAPPDERARLLARAGELRARHGQDARAAIDALREALRLDPTREDARRRLTELAQAGEHRLAAAQALEPAARAARDAPALFVALIARAELAADAGERLTALEHASAIAERDLGDAKKAFELAGRGLNEAVHHDGRRVGVWLDRVEKLAAVVEDAPLRAAILSGALGDRAIDSRPLARLARAAGDALEAVGQIDRALAAYHRALAFEPSTEIRRRVERLAGERKTPEERVRMLEAALEGTAEPTRRRALRLELAALLCEMGNPAGAVRTLAPALDDDDRDAATLEALADALAASLDEEELAAVGALVRRTAAALEATGRTQVALDLLQRAVAGREAPIALVVVYFRLLMRKAEETLGDRAAAVAYVAKHVLAEPERRMDAPLAIALMLPAAPDLAGTLESLETLRTRSEGSLRTAIDLVVAEVLLDRAERPHEALDRLERVLGERPDELGALPILERALALPAARARAASLLLRALPLVPETERALGILERVADATQPVAATDAGGVPADHDTPDALARAAWFESLIDRLTARPEIALAAAVRAVRELPDQDALWDRAEALARAVGHADPVASAYRAVLEAPSGAPYLAHIGKRAVAFQEEWSDRPDAVVDTLRALLAIDPAWAFDRLKLVLSSTGRYDELFDLYDGALRTAATDGERMHLLEEAAQLAKDFAADVSRAIGYLEALAALRPDDARLDATLERLYERSRRTRDLIDLLARRIDRLPAGEATAARLELLGRIASLWLELGDEPQALARVDEMLALDPTSEAAFERLARIVLAAADAPMDAQTDEITAARKRLPLDALRRAAATLKARFAELGRMGDVARAASVELDTATNDAERIAAHAELLELCTALGEHAAAFDHAAALLDLDPAGEGRVARLAEIAERIGRSDRLAEVLESVATRTHDVLTSATLHREAARVQARALGAADRAAALYERAMELARSRAPSTRPRGRSASTAPAPASAHTARFVLETARELLPLYARPGTERQRCDVLETIAALEEDREARRAAYGEAAALAAGPLADPDRAVSAYRARLADDSTDREALDGLVEVLARAGYYEDLVDALERRAEASAALGPEGAKAARRDRVRVAEVYERDLRNVSDAIDAWRRVRALHGLDEESFAAITRLLEQQGRFADLCDVLSEEARASTDAARRVALLCRLGALAHETTHEPERAVLAFREALSLDPRSEAARTGVAALLDVVGVRGDAIDALARAVVETGDWARAAELAAALTEGEDVPAAVARKLWWGVALFHRDTQKDAALAEWALGRALAHDPGSAEILTTLAAVQREHPGRPLVETLVRLSDVEGGNLELLREAAEVALATLESPKEGAAMCERLLDLAIQRWTSAPKKEGRKKRGAAAEVDDPRSLRAMAAWALDELIRISADSGDFRRVVDLHLRWAELPFERPVARARRLTAAGLAAERLSDAEAAIRIHRALLDEDAGDDVAREAVSRLAELLLARGETVEVTHLWEDQARLRERREEERATAAELWARAAELAESKLGDVERALSDYEAGARLGSRRCLAALARIRTARGEHAAAATALEALCAELEGDQLGAHVLLLADALVAAGDPEGARERLRKASATLADPGKVRARLARLYRDVAAWDELAALETQEAERTAGAERLHHLREAAEIHLLSRKSPADAVPLLQAARALDPDDATLGLLLAESLLAVGQHRAAMQAASDSIARYGSRRPKERALCHYALARAARAAGETAVALSELDTAAKMDPAHPGILHALGRLAVDMNEIDRAARAYQALLLIRGPADLGAARKLHESLIDLTRREGEPRDGEFSRAELLLELADLSDRRGDVVRGAEFRESAAAAARESPEEAARYDRALAARGTR